MEALLPRVLAPGSVVSDDILERQQDRNIVLIDRFKMQWMGSVQQQVVVVAGYSIFALSVAFSTVTFAGIFYGLSPFVAVPVIGVTLLVGGCSFYVAQSYVNLNDPGVRQKISRDIEREFRDFELQFAQGTLHHLRSDAAHFLEGIAAKYGWEALFYYGLAEPALFSEIFHFQARLLSITEVIALYEKVIENYELARQVNGENLFEYEFPHPSAFVEKWHRERIRIHITEILKPGILEKLEQYQILSEGEREFLFQARSTYQTAYRTFCHQIRSEWTALQEAIAPERMKYVEARREIDREYCSKSVHTLLREMRRRQIREEAELKEQRERDPELVRGHDEYETFRRSLENTIAGPPSESRTAALGYLELSRTRFQDVRMKVTKKYEPLFTAIRQRYERLFRPLFRELELIRYTRNGKLHLAANEYNESTKESRQRYEILIAEPKRVYLEALSQLGHSYIQHCT